jgi:3-oxoacyl-[acyl-carrier protein] reductase
MAGLDGKVALVTGGSRGIGAAIAARLAGEGALVIIHYASDDGAAEEVVRQIEVRGGAAFGIRERFGVDGDVKRLFSRVDRELEQRRGANALDILVNNAGICIRADLADTTLESYDDQFAINVRAAFFATKEAARRMGNGGRIICVTSLVTRQAWPDLLAYAMTKGALDVFAQTLAKDLAPRGITVNAVAPGIVDTDMNASWLRATDEGRALAAAASPFGRVGEAADIADVVAFAASPDSRWVTGQILDASGGGGL